MGTRGSFVSSKGDGEAQEKTGLGNEEGQWKIQCNVGGRMGNERVSGGTRGQQLPAGRQAGRALGEFVEIGGG